MVSLPKMMGGSDSTSYAGNSIIHSFNIYQKTNSEPFLEEITLEDVLEDNISTILTGYRNWISATDIPKYFYENLQSICNLKINATTINSFLIKIIITLTEKFLCYHNWEYPKWVTRINREYFEKKCKPKQCRSNVDVYEDTKCGKYITSLPWI